MSNRTELRESRWEIARLPAHASGRPITGAILAVLHPISRDIVLAALALILSTILWLVVTNEQNPPVEGLFPYEVPVRAANIPDGLDVFGDLGTVRVRISAPRDAWNRLRVDSFDAKVDLSQSAFGRREMPVRVDVHDPQLTVLEVNPQQIPVWLEPRQERSVPVRVEVKDGPPEGYSYRAPNVSVPQASVSGPASLVDEIDAAVAEVSVASARVTINQQVPLYARSRRGNRITNVRVDPAVVAVEIPIDQQVQYKAVPVHPVVTGDVSEGFWMESIRSDPAVVVLVGTRDALQSVSFVQTAPVEIRDARQSVERVVGLALPEGVAAAGQANIRVLVSVAPIESEKSLRAVPVVRGLPPNLTYRVSDVLVVVRGPSPLLGRLGPADVSVVADAGDLSPGTREIVPAVFAPPGIRVVRMVPDRIRVEIQLLQTSSD